MRTPASIIFVLGAFILSAWGNVIAASLCPRYLARNCYAESHTQPSKKASHTACPHEMGGMEMSDMQMDDAQVNDNADVERGPNSVRDDTSALNAKESSDGQTALDDPNEPCGHCWMHSQPPQGRVTLAGINSLSRPVEAPAPSIVTAIASPFPNPIETEPSEHSPPGNTFPLHILINIFRI